MIAIFSNAVFLPPFCKDVANISVAPSDTFGYNRLHCYRLCSLLVSLSLTVGHFQLFCCSKWLSCYLREFFFTSLRTTCSPAAGLSATDVWADWLLDWSLAAKWAQLLITYLCADYPTLISGSLLNFVF